MVVKPLGPWSSRIGSANGFGTPKAPSEGPIPRKSTVLGSVPVIMIPPIPTLASVRTRRRVEKLRACTGPGVGLGEGDPPAVAVAVGVAEPPAVAVAVGVAEPPAVAVAVGVVDDGTVAVA